MATALLRPTRCVRSQRPWLLRAMSSAKPVLPEAQVMEVNGRYNVKYVDVRPASASESPTIVLIHGAPGSHNDFKHLIPLLQSKARVIGINLPGNGGSEVRADKYYEHVRAIDLARTALDTVRQLCSKDEPVFVLGHSFGGHATLNLAAMNEESKDVNLRGLALIASAGLRPHKALQPRTNAIAWQMLRSNVEAIERFAHWLVKFAYVKVLKFPANAPTDHYVAGIVRCATTEFPVVKAHVDRVRHIPTFFAWARDDAFMEEEIFLELSEELHPGPRFAFNRGGHNIQKTKATFLADRLLAWTNAVISDDKTVHSKEIEVHP
ncbi:hypothetical protein Poli38472_014114 [Pythium oligandrum]|uniref:AB hydrolase-1 domain-containing protein n=1 Tax=Pythium oligandrum TaxID=41045 RepID=A0A8K1CNH2_PYTOL|nr:hypothetical protein Poli38472_014114 [Pythium oligandrum]|eukprot:TMW66802.1 hypothetical protein Poli38472_014114 [Pythium oligandrum]